MNPSFARNFRHHSHPTSSVPTIFFCPNISRPPITAMVMLPRYARVPAMTGRPRKGDEVTTRDRPVGEARGWGGWVWLGWGVEDMEAIQIPGIYDIINIIGLNVWI